MMVAGASARAVPSRQRAIASGWRAHSALCALVATFPIVAFSMGLAARHAKAYTPDSPEVLAMVDKGLAYLEKNTDDRLGGKCLVALAFHKRGLPATHPRIVEAVEACRSMMELERNNQYIYGKALAIIFLAELDASTHGDVIRKYVEMLPSHQKEQGGYGYWALPTGDTSQTQYAALAYWELLNHGISPDPQAVQKCLAWLMRTQDPTGVWGYQGQDPGTYSLVSQSDRAGRSMGAAGLASTMILGNAVGLLTPATAQSPNALSDSGELTGSLPPALTRKEAKATKRVPVLPAGNVSPQQLTECVTRGRGWWDKNFGWDVAEFQFYYVYSIERLKSFDGYLSGGEDAEPDWYNSGVEYLRKTQAADGSWNDGCGNQCATAFATLFLLRSTQQSIKASLGEGTLVGGRGLPRDLSKVRLRGGKLVVQQNATELDQLLEMMEDGKTADFDGLIDNPAALEVGDVTPEVARRLQQVVRSGAPQTRLLAVRALAKARSLDYAPTLIFALTDPDRAVVREARDGLRFVSRNFEGFGPPDNFDDSQRNQAIVRWKAWYATMRPDAPPLP
jgi:hypothetical protein